MKKISEKQPSSGKEFVKVMKEVWKEVFSSSTAKV